MKPRKPPKAALTFLRWFCREDYLEEIEGDLLEVYYSGIHSTAFRAQWSVWVSVLRLFRPGFIRKFKRSFTQNTTTMFYHSLLIALRNFSRHKGSFIINLAGLSTGLACTLLIYLWVSDELEMDSHFNNNDRIYQVMEHRQQDGALVHFTSTSGPTAQALKDDFPEVTHAATVTRPFKLVVSLEDNDLREEGIYASSEYLDIFSYPMLYGNRETALDELNAIVLTESFAASLFGSPAEALDKDVVMQHDKTCKVTGIIADPGPHSSRQFSYILTFESFVIDNEWANSWQNTAPHTFILLDDAAHAGKLNTRLKDYVREKTENAVIHRDMFIQRFSETYLHGDYENGQLAGGRIEYIRLFSLIAIFTLVIACINFMNLSTARASRRMKEVGVKKTVGAQRGTLIFQFLSESMVIVLFAMLIAIVLVILVLPQFNNITGKALEFSPGPGMIGIFIGVAILTGLLAGSYPALFLSGFRPSWVLKGVRRNSWNELIIRKGLVVFQFVLSVVLIVSVLVIHQQVKFIQNRHLGFSKTNLVYVDRLVFDLQKQQTFISELNELPGVVRASGMGHGLTGHASGTYGVEWPGKDPEDRTEFENLGVTYDIIELLEIGVREGRTFSRDYPSDSSAIIFNQSAIDFMGLEDPIGKTIKLLGEDRTIIGVVEDFNFESLHERIKPLFFRLSPGSVWNYVVRIKDENKQETLASMKELSERIYPGFPFVYKFMDEEYDKLYAAESRMGSLSGYFAALAIIISCLGLGGLATYTAENRTKEIGIRKILGATDIGIVSLLTRDLGLLVVISIVIAIPLSYFLITDWLSTFEFHIALKWWFFAGAGIIALFIALLSMSFQTIRASFTSPVRCIRNE